MKILAVDPGKLSGIAWWDDHHGLESLMLDHFNTISYCEVEIFKQLPDLVVCENFIITQNTLKKSRGEFNWSIEQMGALRYFCHRNDIEFETPPPSDAKEFVKNPALKKLGVYRPGAGHDNDALRLAITALANHDNSAFIKLYRTAGLI